MPGLLDSNVQSPTMGAPILAPITMAPTRKIPLVELQRLMKERLHPPKPPPKIKEHVIDIDKKSVDKILSWLKSPNRK